MQESDKTKLLEDAIGRIIVEARNAGGRAAGSDTFTAMRDALPDSFYGIAATRKVEELQRQIAASDAVKMRAQAELAAVESIDVRTTR